MDKSADKNLHAVVFEGKRLPGHSEAAVKRNLAGLFKASVKDIEQRLFSGKRIVIRKNLTRAQAVDVRARLNKLGADCKIILQRESVSMPVSRPMAKPVKKKVRVRTGLIVAAALVIVCSVIVVSINGLTYYKDIFSSRSTNFSKTPKTQKTSEIQRIAEVQKTSEIQRIAEVQKTSGIQNTPEVKTQKAVVGAPAKKTITNSEMRRMHPPSLHKHKYTSEIEIMRDFALEGFKAPRSEWYKSQQRLYWGLLRKQSVDVLVVPFQVQYYGIDRPGRSLMTRYLADYIERSTGLTVADPTLVSRALGERDRRFDFRLIDWLVSELGVKYVVMGYVGHNFDDKMKLQILVKQVNNNDKRSMMHLETLFHGIEFGDASEQMQSSFFSNTQTIVDMDGSSFSDEELPSEAFRGMLDEIVSKLPIKSSKPSDKYYKRTEKLEVPKNMKALVEKNSSSPVINAYYLQLMGMLYPDETVSMEGMFERSLVALEKVSSKSPDYALLKARALFYLYRRPAAIKALGTPETPAEKAFHAFLNGDLNELKQWTQKIQSPLLKLISEIELNDLKFKYTSVPASEEDLNGIVDEYPDWKLFLAYRIYRDYIWFVQSNIVVKAMLDEDFPVKGKTAKDLATKSMLSGEFAESKEIEFSPYNHVYELISDSGEKYFLDSDSINPRSRDYIDILDAMGTANLLRAVEVDILARGLYKEAKETISRYEEIYKEHPRLSYLEAVALENIARNEIGASRERMKDQKISLLHNTMYWFQGQVRLPTKDYRSVPPHYAEDFPHRAEEYDVSGCYHVSIQNDLIKKAAENFGEERMEEILSDYHYNKYTNYNFGPLKKMLGTFEAYDLSEAAETVRAENENRFKGNPDRYGYMADLSFLAGDLEEAKAIYREYIGTVPTLWEPYHALGKIFASEGDFPEALRTFRSYPLFNESERRNAVALSNYAYNAGLDLVRLGGLDESIPMFKLSESYNTGSGAEMYSSAWLAIINRDFEQAALHYFREARRYNNDSGYSQLIFMLHLNGQHEKANEIFNAITAGRRPHLVFMSVLVRRRLEQKSVDEALEWIFQREDLHRSYYVPLYFVLDSTTDRTPDQDLVEQILRWKDKPIRDVTAKFAEGYIALRKGDYDLAYQTLSKSVDQDNSWSVRECSYLYAVVSAIQSGKTSELPGLRKRYERYGKSGEYQEQFFSILADAYVFGKNGKQEKAMETLKMARYRIPWTSDRMMIPMYQLVEIAEWLYEDTNNEEYRRLALEWSKYAQRILPMYSWAYAVEAKLTDSEADRTRALAITLYLDKDSEHIRHFSKKDKEKALRWFENNNPFVSDKHRESA